MQALLAAASATCSVLLFAAAISSERSMRRFDDARRQAESTRIARHPSPRTMAMATAALGAATGWFVAGPPGVVGGALASAAIPFGIARRRTGRLARRLEEQLLEAVVAIASALRAGRSLIQALGVAGEEVGHPLGEVLDEAADRAALGVPLDEVLDGIERRIGGTDARLVTGVLRLHRRTGGALAASLDDLTRTLRARRDGARELRSLTAQARLSAAILGLLPLGFFLFMSVVARRDIEGAYRTTAGASAIGVGLTLQAAAFIWIRRLLRVEEA